MMRVGVVHDWLTGMRGGERVLDAILELYPDADLLTLVHVPGSVSERIEARRIRTSFLQRVPGLRTRWRWGLPLFPAAIERVDAREYDLLLSSSHCVAKAIVPRPDAVHVSYVHTPMRYVWDQYEEYFGPGRASLPVRLAMRALAPRLRRWDRETAGRVHGIIANSAFVARRIRRVWDRDATVVHPPVDVERFRPGTREDFHLIVSALVPYKRVDVAIEAFRGSGRRLVVVGDGPEYGRLRARATDDITFTGRVSDAEVADLLGRCRTFVQTAEEDFGIAVVEAQAAGAPVVALGEGGALESVVDVDDADGREPTGVLFRPRTPDALRAAVARAERHTFDTDALLTNARRFAPERFREEFTAAVQAAVEGGKEVAACVSSR